MPVLKLTERAIARLPAPDPSGKQVLHFDTELKGFAVLVSGVSSAKSYVVQRPLPSGNTRRVTIARTNVMSLADATVEAKKVLATFYRGLDPKATRRGEATLRAALADYLTARADLKPRSVIAYRYAAERYLKPWLDRPLRSIARAMVEERLRTIGRRHGPAAANGAMRTLRVLYNHVAERAPASNPMPMNPVKLKKLWLPDRARTRMVKPEELPAFYRAVCALPNPVARDFLLLVLYTGLRRLEAAALRWEEIDLGAKVIRLPALRTKAGRALDLPMTDLVFDLLRARRAIGDTKFVFPSNSRSGHIMEPKFPLRMVAEATGIEVSAHDLRRTFVTVAESADISAMALKALVNHSLGPGVTEGYVVMNSERLREPAQKVADKLRALLNA